MIQSNIENDYITVKSDDDNGGVKTELLLPTTLRTVHTYPGITFHADVIPITDK